MNGRFLGLAFWLMAFATQVGCAMVPPFDQTFVEVRTPHFEILSSFDEQDTRELSRSLELFHAGMSRALGIDPNVRTGERIRVLAFDDRSATRPFGIRGDDAYFVPGVDRSTIVLRTSAEWREAAPPELRHRIAHRRLRDETPHRYPLWLEEGLAQLAGAVDVRGERIQIGTPLEVHTTRIRDWRRGSLKSLLNEKDLSDYTQKARADFDARSWALVHMLRSMDLAGQESGLDRLRKSLDDRNSPQLFETLGASPEELSGDLLDYVEKGRFRVEVVQLAGWDESETVVTPISPAEARVALAELALSLERFELAEEYFERALADDPDNALALAGLACATADRFEAAEPRAQRAVAATEGNDARVLVRVADFYRRAAESESLVDGQREARLDRARSLYEKAIQIDSQNVDARVGLARVFLDEDRDLAEGFESLEAARAMRPGSLELDLVFARFKAAMGADYVARRFTTDAISRSHSGLLEEQGQSLLETLPK